MTPQELALWAFAALIASLCFYFIVSLLAASWSVAAGAWLAYKVRRDKIQHLAARLLEEMEREKEDDDDPVQVICADPDCPIHGGK